MTVYFLGAGQMASAIAEGMAAQGSWDICMIDRSPDKAASLAERCGFRSTAALPALSDSDVLVLAVKPQDMKAAVAGLPVGGALILSVAAGLDCATLSAWLGGTSRIVRVMPNTPAKVGMGVAGLFAAAAVADEDRQTAERIMAASGRVVWLDTEDGLHRITGISGSGPAYVFYLMDALAAAARTQGFDAESARDLVLATFKGAVALAESSDTPFAQLQQNVMSKGGTTYEAVQTFERFQVASALAEGVAACVARSREIGRQLQETD